MGNYQTRSSKKTVGGSGKSMKVKIFGVGRDGQDRSFPGSLQSTLMVSRVDSMNDSNDPRNLEAKLPEFGNFNIDLSLKQ